MSRLDTVVPAARDEFRETAAEPIAAALCAAYAQLRPGESFRIGMFVFEKPVAPAEPEG